MEAMFSEGIYPVITEKFCLDRSSIDVLREIGKAGVKVVQLREKEMSKNTLYDLALKFRQITNEYDMKLIINDHLDIALATKADGVHLGQDDMPCAPARRIAPNLIIGISTHNLEEALQAQQDGASNINIGPIFPTKTKEIPMNFLGIDALIKIKEKINIPFTIMGGIKEDNIQQLIDAGARRIAMVTEITQADDICGKAKKLQQIIIEAVS